MKETKPYTSSDALRDCMKMVEELQKEIKELKGQIGYHKKHILELQTKLDR